MYRVDRYDVPSDIPDGSSVAQALTYCCRHVIRIYSREGSRTVENGYSTGQSMSKQHVSLRQRAKQLIRREDVTLHTNACGDFTLMAREHWLAVRGYAEFEMRAFKIDGLLCYAAHYAGAREAMLRDPIRIYHIEHPARADGLAGAMSEQNPMSGAGMPQLSRDQYAAWVTQMRKRRQPIVFNKDEGWGLADTDLPEIVVCEGIGK